MRLSIFREYLKAGVCKAELDFVAGVVGVLSASVSSPPSGTFKPHRHPKHRVVLHLILQLLTRRLPNVEEHASVDSVVSVGELLHP